MSPLRKITKLQDGARILWQRRLASLDSAPNEGFVREFDRTSEHVRISATNFKDDAGKWWAAGDLLLVNVLEENVQLRDRPRRPREEGDEWKDSCA